MWGTHSTCCRLARTTGQAQAAHHAVESHLRGDVLRQLLAAGADSGLGGQQAIFAHALGKFARQAREVRVGHLHLSADFQHERIAVNTGEIHEGDVEAVGDASFSALLVELFHILQGTAGVALRLGRALALGADAEGLFNLGALRLLRRRVGVLGFLLNELQQRRDGLKGLGAVEDVFGQVDGHGAAL